VDDNITSNMDQAKEFFHALIPLKVRWVSRPASTPPRRRVSSTNQSQRLPGTANRIETLNPENLRRMHKGFNLMKGGYEKALENLRRHEIRLYATFILGYDEDNGDTLRETLAFAETPSVLYRCLQPPHALSRDATLRTTSERKAPSL